MTSQQAISQAMLHFRGGRIGQAEGLFRRALAIDPNESGALHMLGLIAHQAGKEQEALDLTARAVAARPAIADFHNTHAMVLAALGRNEEAIDAFARAVQLRPNDARLHNNLGNGLCAVGQTAAGIAEYQKALSLRADFADAKSNLGHALLTMGDFVTAAGLFREVIAKSPNFGDAHNGLGRALAAAGEIEAAIASYQRALALQPRSAAAHNNLGNALCRIGRTEDAVAEFEAALETTPGDLRVMNNLANARCAIGQLDRAITVYRSVLEKAPNTAETHWNLGCTLLLRGELEMGWPEYEWRWRVKELHPTPRIIDKPQWTGAALEGRTILLHAEQGMGDAIQVARYVPMVAQRGGRVILECQAALRRLLERVPGVAQLVEKGAALPNYDVHCGLMSLPMVFGTTLATIPAVGDYLKPPEELTKLWKQRIDKAADGRRKIGLAWSGSPEFKFNADRSMPLSALSPLGSAGDNCFFSLQKGPAAAQAKNPGPLRLVDLSADLGDFADTAAVMLNLEMVITVDTSVAHLAGSLGVQTWVLLQFVPDWRWLLGREDSPWYPAMRLYRQHRLRDWAGPIARIAKALQ